MKKEEKFGNFSKGKTISGIKHLIRFGRGTTLKKDAFFNYDKVSFSIFKNLSVSKRALPQRR